MSGVLWAQRGMRVLTPRNEIARIEGLTDGGDRYRLTYLNPELGEVTLARRVLRSYDGPPVLFADELARLRAAAQPARKGRR